MSSFKVSVAFLEGTVATIVAKSTHIARSMKSNTNFPVPPVSPEGLKGAADHLKEMQGKVKAGNYKDEMNRDEALADVDDFIRQQAEYINHACNYDLDKLTSSGFDLHKEEKVTSLPAKVTSLTIRNGRRPGEVIALTDLVQHCTVAIGRFSTDPDFGAAYTSEVVGSSRTRVLFSALPRGAHLWISVKCRGLNGDSEWCAAQEINVK